MRRLRRFVFALLKVAVILYATMVGILWFMQDAMLYHRSDGAPMLNDPALLPKREIVCLTTADELNLRAWYFRARADMPTVLFLHGNAGDIGNHLPFAKFLIEAGYGVLALEYRGYGGNPGKPNEPGLIEDGRAGLAFLKAQGIPDSGIVLYGESLGTGIAVQLAAEHRVRARRQQGAALHLPRRRGHADPAGTRARALRSGARAEDLAHRRWGRSQRRADAGSRARGAGFPRQTAERPGFDPHLVPATDRGLRQLNFRPDPALPGRVGLLCYNRSNSGFPDAQRHDRSEDPAFRQHADAPRRCRAGRAAALGGGPVGALIR